MRNRLRIILATVAVAALAVAAVAVASGASAPHITQPTTLQVVEHPATDTVINTGPRGDSTGDLLTFHNKLYNASNTKVIGSDQGSCIRIDPAQGSWECSWTNFVPGGHITVEGRVLRHPRQHHDRDRRHGRISKRPRPDAPACPPRRLIQLHVLADPVACTTGPGVNPGPNYWSQTPVVRALRRCDRIVTGRPDG